MAPTRDGKAGIELLRALQLIGAIGAELTPAAYTGHPLDANPVTLFPQLFHIVGYCHHDASSFVARDAHGVLMHLYPSGCELIVEGTSIGSTNATVVDFAEDLARSGMWDGDRCDSAFGRVAFAYLHPGFLISWEMHCW